MRIPQIISAVAIGLLATSSPCVLPVYPGTLAFLSGAGLQRAGRARYLLGVAILAGVLVMMLALGGLLALVSVSIGRLLSVLLPIADLVIIGLGALLVLGKNPFARLPQINAPLLSHPLGSAFDYGLLYGPLTLAPAHHSRAIYLAGGLLLVGVGVFDLASNWRNLRLYW